MRLNKTTLVKTILTHFPQTRDNDYLLWLKVLETATHCDYIDFLNMPVKQFLSWVKYMKAPHYETVSRTRRKLQEHYPELRASAETQAARDELEEEYRQFARTSV